jgi:hypothetical protein
MAQLVDSRHCKFSVTVVGGVCILILYKVVKTPIGDIATALLKYCRRYLPIHFIDNINRWPCLLYVMLQ